MDKMGEMIELERDDAEVVTAYHEAGHALLAVLQRGYLLEVTLDPEVDRDDLCEAKTTVRWPAAMAGSQRVQAELLVLLAGPASEMIYRGEPLHPGFVPQWADDWQNAWQLAKSIYADQHRRLRELERMTAMMRKVLYHDQNWAAVAAIADQLLAHRTLDQAMVVDAVSVWVEL